MRRFVKRLARRAVKRINRGVSRTLTARRLDENPPLHTRHLTDTRTRVSNLLEYALAYEMNRVLESDEDNRTISAVLWNVFPDLIIRDKELNNLAGLEIKALHTAAEEKSANLSTPLSVIRKKKDFLVVLVWGWKVGNNGGVKMYYPHVHSIDVLNAWCLARIRDLEWLRKEGNGLKARPKGIDLGSPLILQQENMYKAEEGNMGKLMRIGLTDTLPRSIPYREEIEREDKKYEQFKQRVMGFGLVETFKDVCKVLGIEFESMNKTTQYPSEYQILGKAVVGNEKRIYFGAGFQPNINAHPEKDRYSNKDCVFWLGSKLNWKIFRVTIDGLQQVQSGDKPETQIEMISKTLLNGTDVTA